MGWFWDSKPATPAAASPLDATAPEPSVLATTPSPSQLPELAEQGKSDASFRDLLKEFYAEELRSQEQKYKTKEGQSKASIDYEPVDISPDSLYPTSMSCRSAFDYAMFCQSFGGQFVNVYRYGEFRSCSNHWNDFWLCMRTRNIPERERARQIREHYQKKIIKYKTGPSSEDVWEVRDVPVQDSMQGNLEELEARIEEWKKANPSAPDPWKQAKTFRTDQDETVVQ
ncbi:hypothetical protein LTR84_012171 [Exophiala bonariae]|uniref:Early meiotic induction protein 1 n=1 Tax=Exophiala bonariae TaxID=1690606 RepID=A0AAV9NFU2_9EURO|nr:hypothetical protein LTR84_012171 [Exophiala bonariae]